MSNDLMTFTDQNWQSEVMTSQQPVLIDFWASWCAPCRALTPTLEAIAAQYAGRLKVGKLNVEENADIPSRYSITALPTLLIIKGGQVAEQRVGLLPKDQLTRLVDDQLA